jgi:excisionase family DNA binding protein
MKNNERSLLWDVEQAATALALSPWTIRSYIRQGKLRPVRVGRRVLFEPAECERFLNACKAAKPEKLPNSLMRHPQRRNRND